MPAPTVPGNDEAMAHQGSTLHREAADHLTKAAECSRRAAECFDADDRERGQVYAYQADAYLHRAVEAARGAALHHLQKDERRGDGSGDRAAVAAGGDGSRAGG